MLKFANENKTTPILVENMEFELEKFSININKNHTPIIPITLR